MTFSHAASGVDRMVSRLWPRARPVVAERLEVLDSAARAAAADELEPPVRRDAVAVAHKLAGSLGSYGIPAGSELAHAIEHELEGDCDPARLSALVADLRAATAAGPSCDY